MPIRPPWTPAALIILAGSAHALAAVPFPASIDLSTLNGTDGFVINGIDSGDFSGFSVSSAGDVNGDGTDDLIIGAYGADPSGPSNGESYVVFGKDTAVAGNFPAALDLSSLNGANGFVINGNANGGGSGNSVSSAGDVNADGTDDLIIGAHRADPNGQSNAGESYVVFGGAGVGAGGSLELSSLTGANGFVLNGIDVNDGSGFSVSSAGDVNADGIDDLILGAYFAAPNGQSAAGESYVVFGKDTAVAGNFPAALDLSTLNGADGFVINGVDVDDRSGISVSSAGDVNGDGTDDVIIGARRADPNGQSYAGESYVVFGGASVGTGGSLDLSALNGTNGFVLNGIDAFDQSGVSVSSAGDVNTDGTDDLIIGAYRAAPNGQSDAGESYVVFGKDTAVAGNFPAALDLSTLNGANGFVLNGIDSGDASGVSVSSAGDVNGDGSDDVIIGANIADPNGQTSAGESYVVFGGAGVGAGGSLDLSSLNGANGFVINGIDGGDTSGRSVSSAGDVNGDGSDDVIIGADLADPNGQSSAGESYVVFGRPTSACCLRATICVDALPVATCTDLGGTFFPAALCANIVCPGCEADLDNDGDTDVLDFGIFALDFGCPD